MLSSSRGGLISVGTVSVSGLIYYSSCRRDSHVSPARELDVDVVSGVLATAALLILTFKLCAQ